MLQWAVPLLWLGASWWACLVGDAGLTSAGACWELESSWREEPKKEQVVLREQVGREEK